jgi:hypothetical protein
MTTTTTNNTLTIETDGLTLSYSPETDSRVMAAENGRLYTRSAKSARELASELRSWGVANAQAVGKGVVFG